MRLDDPVKHRRLIELDKAARRVVIEDTLEMGEEHDVELFFHCSEHCRVDPCRGGFVVSQRGAFPYACCCPRSAAPPPAVSAAACRRCSAGCSRAFDRARARRRPSSGGRGCRVNPTAHGDRDSLQSRHEPAPSRCRVAAQPRAAPPARTQLLPEPGKAYDAQHLSETLNLVAPRSPRWRSSTSRIRTTGSAARARAGRSSRARTIQRGATVLVLKDGRTLSAVSMKRADLRRRSRSSRRSAFRSCARRRRKTRRRRSPSRPQLLAPLAEIERLLRAADRAVGRDARTRSPCRSRAMRAAGSIANLAMQLVSAVHETSGKGEAGDGRVAVALARLRTALEEEEKTQ